MNQSDTVPDRRRILIRIYIIILAILLITGYMKWGRNVEAETPAVDYGIGETQLLSNNSLIGTKMPDIAITQTLGVMDDLIDRLAICESGNNNLAVNPMDLDGTPSWGKFQFKIGTWKHYVKKYDLFLWQDFEEADWWNTMMCGDLQRIVVEKCSLTLLLI